MLQDGKVEWDSLCSGLRAPLPKSYPIRLLPFKTWTTRRLSRHFGWSPSKLSCLSAGQLSSPCPWQYSYLSIATYFSRATYFSWPLWPIPNSTSPCPSNSISPVFPYPLLPQETKTSPSGVTCSGASYHPGPEKLYYLREVANGEGTVRILVPFSLTELAQCKQELDIFSEDPSKFVEGFHALILVYD